MSCAFFNRIDKFDQVHHRGHLLSVMLAAHPHVGTITGGIHGSSFRESVAGRYALVAVVVEAANTGGNCKAPVDS